MTNTTTNETEQYLLDSMQQLFTISHDTAKIALDTQQRGQLYKAIREGFDNDPDSDVSLTEYLEATEALTQCVDILTQCYEVTEGVKEDIKSLNETYEEYIASSFEA